MCNSVQNSKMASEPLSEAVKYKVVVNTEKHVR